MDAQRRFRAHPESAPGDFYVVNGECIACGAPHAVAPDLIGWAKSTDHCIWKKQPATEAELEQALAAFDVSEVGCYRYAGADPAIMETIGIDYCDRPPPRALKPKSPREPPPNARLTPSWRPVRPRWATPVRLFLLAAVAAALLWLLFGKF